MACRKAAFRSPPALFCSTISLPFQNRSTNPRFPSSSTRAFETRHGVDGHPEDVEEVEVETLGLALLVPGLRPLLGELPARRRISVQGRGTFTGTTGRLSHSGLSDLGIPLLNPSRPVCPAGLPNSRARGGVRSRCADAQRRRCKHRRSQPAAHRSRCRCRS